MWVSCNGWLRFESHLTIAVFALLSVSYSTVSAFLSICTSMCTKVLSLLANHNLFLIIAVGNLSRLFTHYSCCLTIRIFISVPITLPHVLEFTIFGLFCCISDQVVNLVQPSQILNAQVCFQHYHLLYRGISFSDCQCELSHSLELI